MKGKHKVIIESTRLKYEFEIKRNITVIQGDSATGKTTLIDLIQTYGRYGQESGINMSSDVPCVAFSGEEDLWKVIIKSYENSIIFFDEDYSFIFTENFADAIKHSSNYYVLITRQPMYNLPYSINEIYGIRTTGKYHFPEKIYHEFYPLFLERRIKDIDNTMFLIEDEKAGYEFYYHLKGENKCISASGNAGIVTQLEKVAKEQQVVVIADGAAFGAYIAKVIAVANTKSNIGMYFPESFEWIILKSGIVEVANIDDILNYPEKYIDSGVFFSWERYFTDLLEKATCDDRFKKYDKRKLNDYYMEGRNLDRILDVLPEELRKLL